MNIIYLEVFVNDIAATLLSPSSSTWLARISFNFKSNFMFSFVETDSNARTIFKIKDRNRMSSPSDQSTLCKIAYSKKKCSSSFKLLYPKSTNLREIKLLVHFQWFDCVGQDNVVLFWCLQGAKYCQISKMYGLSLCVRLVLYLFLALESVHPLGWY